jgi:hypothetical protein
MPITLLKSSISTDTVTIIVARPLYKWRIHLSDLCEGGIEVLKFRVYIAAGSVELTASPAVFFFNVLFGCAESFKRNLVLLILGRRICFSEIIAARLLSQ